jgi:hypothetical protein
LDTIQHPLPVIGNFDTPFLTRAEFAVDIFENIACKGSGLPPSRFVVGEFFSDMIGAWLNLSYIEEISWHGVKMPRGSNAFREELGHCGIQIRTPRLNAESTPAQVLSLLAGFDPGNLCTCA